MEEPSAVDQEAVYLAKEVVRLRAERDAWRSEFDARREAEKAMMSAQLRLLSVDLTKGVQNDFYALLKWFGWIIAIGVTVATAGGLIAIPNVMDSVINKQVETKVNEKVKEKDDDFRSLRTTMLHSLADFTIESKKALDVISSTTGKVQEAGETAVRQIGIRVASVSDLPAASVSQSTTVPPAENFEISVVVHVVFRTPEENISDEQVNSQIAVLNDDYGATNKDLAKVPDPFKPLIGNARIHFSLAKFDPTGGPTSGITRTRTREVGFGVGDKVKSRLTGGIDPWDTERYLNIWVATVDGGLLSYAQVPGGPPKSDGVVVYNIAFGTTGSAYPPYNKGRTATAEIARYLNIRHIWGDRNDCVKGDFVEDTPVQAGPNFGKPAFPHITCGNGPNGDMFMNFADYVDDDSMYMFTKGQVQRMHATLQGPRKKLIQR